MDIEIVVIGESGKWVLNLPRIRIGLDPNCEVSLPPGRYPAVAGEHLVLEMVNGAVSLARGMPPGGETFLNGHPAGAGAAIRSGDILRLGAGGPELRIRLLERETYAPTAQPAAHAPVHMSRRACCMNPRASSLARQPRPILPRRPSRQRQWEDRVTQPKPSAEFPPLPGLLYRNQRQAPQKVKI